MSSIYTSIGQKYVDHLSVKKARHILSLFSPCPNGTCGQKNEYLMPFSYDLQIVIPAFNVEQYLGECINSILKQKTKYSFCIIVIDDGSSDHTDLVADSFKSIKNVKVIHQENRGFSGARNAGMKQICAEYLMFVDSDDTLPPNAIQCLMETAKTQNMDIVQGSWIEWMPDAGRKRVIIPEDIPGYPWGKVYRSSLFSGCCFPEGFWYEDTMIPFKIVSRANRITCVDSLVYNYRIRPKSITQTSIKKRKSVDTYWVTEQVLADCESHNNKSNNWKKMVLSQFCLNARRIKRMPLLIQTCVFVLTVDLYNKLFITNEKEILCPIEEALKMKRFEAYLDAAKVQ